MMSRVSRVGCDGVGSDGLKCRAHGGSCLVDIGSSAVSLVLGLLFGSLVSYLGVASASLSPILRLSYALRQEFSDPNGYLCPGAEYHPDVPELPEVETVRRSLERRLPGRVFQQVEVRAPVLREALDKEALSALEGSTVERLGRRAKYLLIHLASPSESRRRVLVIHLGMSGRFTVVSDEAPYDKHEHLAIRLSDSDGDRAGRLRLVDPRRFGQAFVLADDDLESDRHFVHLGVEPVGATEGEPEDGVGFDGAYLESQAECRRGPVKTFLMDARVVVGVGNIYASEALWRARVHPKRSVARVSSATWTRLADAVREVLSDAIAQGGTTLNDFTDGEGNAGYFQVSLDVYDREGEPCRRCGRPIRRIVQSNRSTYYCPGCQR